MELCFLTTIILCYCTELLVAVHSSGAWYTGEHCWAPAAQLAQWTVIGTDKYKTEKEAK